VRSAERTSGLEGFVMFARFASVSVFAFCLALVLGMPGMVSAAEKSHDGKVVSVTAGSGTADGKLVMTDKDGKKEHSHAISSKVKITLDKKEAKLTDLKKGDAITVTTDDDGKVTAVAASREKA
jgi:hypothetical protein